MCIPASDEQESSFPLFKVRSVGKNRNTVKAMPMIETKLLLSDETQKADRKEKNNGNRAQLDISMVG